MRLLLSTASNTRVRIARWTLLGTLGIGLLGVPAYDLAAEAADVSDWSVGNHVRVRLIDAGPRGKGRVAGLEIQLDPGFLTYWRSPGEAGLPPTADIAGSQNVATATLSYPAPSRYEEAGVEAFGYRDQVIFPIDVEPADPQRPLSLSVVLSFAVCAELCLPARASVHLDLAGSGQSPEAALVREAQRLVPVPQPLNGPGVLTLEKVETGPSGVTARMPAGTTAQLFAEAPDPWFFQTGPGRSTDADHMTFDLHVVAGSKMPAKIPVTLTLATETQAIETTVQLDVQAPRP